MEPPSPSKSLMRNKSLTIGIFIIAVMIVAFPIMLAVTKILRDPAVPFLLPDSNAQWITIDRPIHLGTFKGNQGIIFKTHITIGGETPDTMLSVKALRSAKVIMDGRTILPFNDVKDWKVARYIDMKGLLTPGTHELRINVLNENGPALLLTHLEPPAAFQEIKWEASMDGVNWRPVRPAKEKRPADISSRFPTTVEALRSLLPVYIPLFAVCFLLVLFRGNIRRRFPWIEILAPRPSTIRWMLLAGWAVLAVNNIFRVPLRVGFDVKHHYEYISYILEMGRIPLATDGWQMFQSPLYYILSAVPQALLIPLFPERSVLFILRLIPLLSGALQIQLAYLAVKYVFPERRDLQVMGTVIGGLLPMNIYISQAVGNEPLAGVLSAMSIVLIMGIMKSNAPSLQKSRLIVLGIVTGLACLTKVSAVLLMPPLVFALIWVIADKKERVTGMAGGIATFLGTAAVVAGWYYVRNWVELGRPFVGGWDISRDIIWWQDPGYRMISDFLSFGRSLVMPIYGALYGFWDSIYSTFWLDGLLSSIIYYEFRPPWNYNFMISSAFLSLLPAAGIIIGIFMTVIRPRSARPGQIFSAYCIAIYFSALLYLYATVPIYSTAKSTYTVGLIPCYAIIAVTGLDYLTRNRYLEAGVYALLTCWSVAAYASYWVIT
jgi:hypothetical protein